MFILSASRPCSSASVQPSHFVFWTGFMRAPAAFYRSGWYPCAHTAHEWPAHPLPCWWHSGHCIPPLSKQCCWGLRSLQGYRQFKESLLPSAILTTGCYFFIHALLSVWLHNWQDITKTQGSSQRSGKGQEGKSAVGDPQFDTAAKGSQLQPGARAAWVAWAACCIPWLKEKDIALPTTEMQKASLIVTHWWGFG